MTEKNPAYRPASQTRARYRILYGGAGSGKSVYIAQDELARVAEDGRQRLLVVRKTLKTCRNSTYQLFKDIITQLGRWGEVQKNDTEMRLTFASGGMIIHAGLDDLEKLKSIHGITRIWVEEASELTVSASTGEHDFDQLDLRLRGVAPELVPQITITYNPTLAARWIRDRFGIKPGAFPAARSFASSDDVYVQHTTHEDNPYAGEAYAKVFARLPVSMRTVYEKGEYAATDAPDQVIPYEAIKKAFDVESEPGRQRLGVDVARFGDDDTALARFNGNALAEMEGFNGYDVARTTRLVQNKIGLYSIGADMVGVDAVGVGGGLVDNLRDLGLNVTEIVSGESPLDSLQWPGSEAFSAFKFRNLRSQMWWYARETLSTGLWHIPKEIISTDNGQKLLEDLLAPRYRIASDKTIEVEPKRSVAAGGKWGVKNRIGRSTDYGDPFIYALIVEHIANNSFAVVDW